MEVVSDPKTLKEKESVKIRRKYLTKLLPQVFLTEGDVAAFDPVKIEQSLIRETNLDQESADRITELVIRRIISSGIKFLININNKGFRSMRF